MRKVTFKGDPLTLIGRALKADESVLTFKAVSADLKEVSLKDLGDSVKIITSFPSLDTPVCDLQVKEFNKRAASVSDKVKIIGISKDLPFAQKRFCDSFGIDKVEVLSDYQYSSFGVNAGLLIKELALLARAVMILDGNNAVRYLQVVAELTDQPDYDDVLKNLQGVITSPKQPPKTVLPTECKPCEGTVAPLASAKIQQLLAQYRGWEPVEDKKLKKEFRFSDFAEAKFFLDCIAVIAEEQGHHPSLSIMYNKVKVTLTTHAAGGLTENDFIMAKIIDEISQ
jgi:thiol peroxidase